MEPEETFTDFMVRCMEGEDEIKSAIVVIRRGNETIGYKCFNQEVSDTLGLLRVAALSVENDLTSQWRNER
jgi:hypothetical protein